MKKLVGLLIVMSLAASVHAGLDISFSSNNGGYWSYTASEEIAGEGTFSFNQPVGVDKVWETTYKPLDNSRVYIPDFDVSNLNKIGPEIYWGNITPVLPVIQVKTGEKNSSVIFTGNLGPGAIVIVGTTASLYPIFNANDITNIVWNKGSGSDSMDFALTLQGGDISQMILHNQINESTGSFSGSMTQIPEPATMFILALGSVLMLRDKCYAFVR